MPWWLVLIGLLVAAALGWLVLDLLLGEADRATQPDTRATLRIDAIRTGLTVVAGTGGGLALLLAAPRGSGSPSARSGTRRASPPRTRHTGTGCSRTPRRWPKPRSATRIGTPARPNTTPPSVG